MPTASAIDVEGLELSAAELAAALEVDVDAWRAELPAIDEWFDKIGDAVPSSLRDELASLKLRLDA